MIMNHMRKEMTMDKIRDNKQFFNGKHKAKDKNKKTFRYTWLSPAGEVIHYVDIPHTFVKVNPVGSKQPVTYTEAAQAMLNNGRRIVREKSKPVENSSEFNRLAQGGFFNKQMLQNDYLKKRMKKGC